MTLPTDRITMEQVSDFLGKPTGSRITLDDPDVRELAQVEQQGERVSMDDLRGKGFFTDIFILMGINNNHDFPEGNNFSNVNAGYAEGEAHNYNNIVNPGRQTGSILSISPNDVKGQRLIAFYEIYDKVSSNPNAFTRTFTCMFEGVLAPSEIESIEIYSNTGVLLRSYNVANDLNWSLQSPPNSFGVPFQVSLFRADNAPQPAVLTPSNGQRVRFVWA